MEAPINELTLELYLLCIQEIAKRLDVSGRDVYLKYGELILTYCNKYHVMPYENLSDIIMKEISK